MGGGKEVHLHLVSLAEDARGYINIKTCVFFDSTELEFSKMFSYSIVIYLKFNQL